MSRRLIDVDPMTGTAQYSHYDEGEDAFRYHQEIEAQPLLDVNRELSNDAPVRWGDGKVIARVPMLQWFLMNQLGLFERGNETALKKWLNDADNRGFRVRPGSV